MAGLWADLLCWTLHSLAAIALLLLVIGAITLTAPSADAIRPKLLATALVLLAPMIISFVIARVWQRQRWVRPARFVWLSGALIFAAAAVWVYGLPPDAAICRGCSSLQQLRRTFFAVDQGTGLMNGDGLLVGCWIPLATIGYSLGASLGRRA